MKHVKRTISLLLTVVLMAGILFYPNGYVEAAGKKNNTNTVTAKKNKQVVLKNITAKKNKPVVLKNIKGKNKKDVAVLKKIITSQKAKGASLSTNLNSQEYTWNKKGRLCGINWFRNGLSGKISFAGLTELKKLICEEENLSSLDVSKNTKLEELSCRFNQLGRLDVSKNTKLKELYCYSNKLSRLDVSKNTKLKVLHCYGNKLKTLDVSKNCVLETLICKDNKLT